MTQGAPRTRRREVGRFRVSLAEFDGSLRIPSHYHDRACVSLVLEGRFVQRFPGAEYPCPPGGLLAKPPGERHDDRWCGVRTVHMIVEPDPEGHESLGPLADVVESVAYRLDPWALGLGRRMARELHDPDDVSDLALEALALELLLQLRRGQPATAGRDAGEQHGGPPRWLQRVRECLHDRHGESLRLQHLASEAGVHPSRLSRAFREHYGTTPAQYLRSVRLRAAVDDLREGRRSLSEIAHRRGFADQSHLTRWLKRTTGLTPGIYRRTRPDPPGGSRG